MFEFDGSRIVGIFSYYFPKEEKEKEDDDVSDKTGCFGWDVGNFSWRIWVKVGICLELVFVLLLAMLVISSLPSSIPGGVAAIIETTGLFSILSNLFKATIWKW